MPPNDWDIAVDLPIATVAGAFERVVRHGEKHGTVMLIVGGLPVEVSVLRGNKGASWEAALRDDLSHRDFTVNAMAADMACGEIIDPCAGQRDLARGLLRGTGDPVARIGEDPLRALRAARFLAGRPWRLDARTRAALATARLDHVAKERQRDELLGLLSAADPLRGLRVLHRAGLLSTLVPPLSPLVATGWKQVQGMAFERPVERWIFWAWHHACNAKAFEEMLVTLRVNRAETNKAARTLAALSQLQPRRMPREAELRHWMAAAEKVTTTAASLAALRWPRAYAGFEATVAHEAAHACLTLAQLAIDGEALLQHGIAPRAIGEMLRQLLALVCDAPGQNQRSLLLKKVDSLKKQTR